MTTHKTELPQSSDWNYYWGLKTTEKFTKVSWSKTRIMAVLEKYVRNAKNVLDAGCGSGFFSKYFCDQGLETFSLDYSSQALDMARQKTQGRAKVLLFDLVSSQLKDKISRPFDLIFTDGLFEHFSASDQDKIMVNFKSVLSENGIIITFVPNRFSPWELIRPFYMPGIEEKPLTMKQLVELNARNGLNIVEQGGVNTLPFSFSPDKTLGPAFGMLLFTASKNNV